MKSIGDIIAAILLALLVGFTIGLAYERRKPITFEVINAKPDWWTYNDKTRTATAGIGSNTNEANNSKWTIKP